MNKRRVVVGLALLCVPLVLAGALLWTRKQAWNRMEEEFRVQLVKNATATPDNSFVVSIEKATATLDLGDWTPAQLRAALKEVHLQKASSTSTKPGEWKGSSLRFETFGGEPDPESGFAIALDGEDSVVGGVRSSQEFREKWSQLELTPESVRALKKRVFALYGKQIEAFQKGKPSS